jgi:hypothetical protein
MIASTSSKPKPLVPPISSRVPPPTHIPKPPPTRHPIVGITQGDHSQWLVGYIVHNDETKLLEETDPLTPDIVAQTIRNLFLAYDSAHLNDPPLTSRRPNSPPAGVDE